MIYLILIIVCVLMWFSVFAVMKQRLTLKLKRFIGRECLSLKDIQRAYYPDCDVPKFEELWREIAAFSEVPSGLIRPSDRFLFELGPVHGFPVPGEMDELEEAFERRCKQQSVDPCNLKIKTVDDYIKQFAIIGRYK